jgi:hypothetical protein
LSLPLSLIHTFIHLFVFQSSSPTLHSRQLSDTGRSSARTPTHCQERTPTGISASKNPTRYLHVFLLSRHIHYPLVAQHNHKQVCGSSNFCMTRIFCFWPCLHKSPKGCFRSMHDVSGPSVDHHWARPNCALSVRICFSLRSPPPLSQHPLTPLDHFFIAQHTPHTPHSHLLRSLPLDKTPICL